VFPGTRQTFAAILASRERARASRTEYSAEGRSSAETRSERKDPTIRCRKKLKVGLVLTASRKAGAFLRVGAAVDAVVVVELEEIVAELPPVINGI